MTIVGGKVSTMPATDATQPASRSIGRLAADIAIDTAALVRKEIDLVKAEIAEKAVSLGSGIGLIAGAVFVLSIALPILTASLVLGLAEFMPAWLAALLVGVLLLIVAAALAAVGARKAKRGAQLTPTEVLNTAREDMEWLRQQTTFDAK